MHANPVLSAVLEKYKKGEIALEDAAQEIEGLRLERVGDFACLDLGRSVPCGMPEFVLAEGKEPSHLAEIAQRQAETAGRCVITRVTPEQVAAIQDKCAGKGITCEVQGCGADTYSLERACTGKKQVVLWPLLPPGPLISGSLRKQRLSLRRWGVLSVRRTMSGLPGSTGCSRPFNP